MLAHSEPWALKYQIRYQIRDKSSPAIWRRRRLPTLTAVQPFVDEGPAPTFDGDSYFTELVRYIHLNPLRVELVEHLKELEKYPYYEHGTARRQGSNLDLST